MPRRKWLSLLCAVVMSMSMVTVSKNSAKAEPEVAWSRAMNGDVYPELIQTSLDGKVRASSCFPDYPTYLNMSRRFDSEGDEVVNSAIPVTTAPRPQPCISEARSAVDAEGNWYTPVQIFQGTYWYYRLASYNDNDQPRWIIDLPGCSVSTGIVLKVGPNGLLYGSTDCGWSGSYLFAVTLDSAPGSSQPTLVFQKGLYHKRLLGIYEDGLVIADDDNDALEYLDFNGELTQSPIAVADSLQGSLWAGASTEGRVFFVHNPTQAQRSNCKDNGHNVNSGIKAYDKTGEQWHYSISDCSAIQQIWPTPGGGFAAMVRIDDLNQPYRWRVLVLTNSGQLRWVKDIDVRPDYPYVTSAVTLAGDVVLQYLYSKAPGYQHDAAVAVKVFSGSYGEEVFSKTFTASDKGRNFTNFKKVAIAKGRMYISIGECVNVCQSVSKPVLYALDIPRLEAEYPEAALLGANMTSRSKYVGMGDSYSSGQGAGDIIPPTEGDQGCNRSANAYPRILDRDASLNLSLQAFVACGGATTQQIIGGKSGEPSQLTVLSDEIEVITLTAGGNDVDFVKLATDCLKASCAVGSAAYAASVQKLVYELPDNLHNLYQAIHQAAQNATVYVVLYPPILPEDNFTNPCTFPPHPVVELLIDESDYEGAMNILDGLNVTIVDEVDEMNVLTNGQFKIVDPSVQYFGHELCRDGGFEEYFNGPMLPERDSLHPKAIGQEALAIAIADEMS